MNANVQNNNVGASQEAVAQNNNNTSFAAKAKKVACKVKAVAEKAAYPVLATAVVTSSVVCATYRIIRLVRLCRGAEK